MTNRRSMASDAARASRAFQFVPGHVGGRVDSAQPVRRRRTIGGASAPPADPPTGAVVSIEDLSPGSTMTLPSLSGYTSAVELIVTRDWNAIALPSGWRELARSASFGGAAGVYGPGKWLLMCVDFVTGTESTTLAAVTREDGGKVSGAIRVSVRFSGSNGGAWSASVGASTSTTTATIQAPPAGSPFVQLGALLSRNATASNPANVWAQGGLCSCYSGAAPGTYTGGSFTAAFTGTPKSGTYSFVTSSWGGPGTQSVAVAWNG